MGPIGYVIMRVQVDDVKGYDEYQVALVTPDNGSFTRRVPVILGIPTTDRVVTVMKKSEIEKLSGPWAHTDYITISRAEAAQVSSIRVNINTVPLDPWEYSEALHSNGNITILPFSGER